MHVDIYSDESCFAVLETDWRKLVPQSQANLIFSTWEWHQCWWSAYHPGDLWVLAVRAAEGEPLIGLMPLFIEPQERGRVARIIGSDDVTDYLDIIAHRDHTEAVYTALAAFLGEKRGTFDVLDMSNIRAESPTRTQFVAALEAQGFTVAMEQQEVCPLFEVPATFDAYLSELDSRERSELRRKLRRADGVEDLAWYIVSDQHDLQAELRAFLVLMAASHPEKAAFLQNPQHVAFFNAFMPVAMQQGWLQLAFLTIEEERVAAYLNFDYDNDILIYNSGLEPNRFGALSAGIVLLAKLIDWAVEHHKRTFNFLRGNETYKYQMGGRDTAVYHLQAK